MAVLQVPLLLLARWLGQRLRVEAVALGWALPLLLLLPWLDGRHVLAPSQQLLTALPGTAPVAARDPHAELNDVVFCLIPWELEVRHALAAGRLPFWSDLVDGGNSPWSNPQAQPLSPVAMLARALPIQHSLLACLALKLLVAFQGAWVLCRLLGAGRGAAALGGGSFALGGGILGWSLFPHSTAAAWAPWVVAGVVVAMRRPRRQALVALALATAALLLSGQPEMAAFAIALAAFAGLWLAKKKRLVRGVVAAALAGALGAALAAPHLVPFAAAARHSLRAGERLAAGPPHVESNRGAHGWFVEEGWQIFPGPFSPLVYGKPYGPTFGGPWAWPIGLSAYTGLVALACAAAALGGRRGRVAAPFLIAWLAALVLTSRFVPLEQLIFRIPPLRVPELSRLLAFGSLGLAVAAALGVEQLGRARRRVPLALLACAALLPALILTPRWEIVLLVVGTAAGVSLVAAHRARAGVALLAGVLLLDLVPWGRPQLPLDDAASFYPKTGTIRALKHELHGGPWRAVAEDLLVYPSLLTVYDVAELRTHNPLAPREQLAVLRRAFGFAPGSAHEIYFSRFGNVEHPLLDFLNTRVVLSNPYLSAKHRLRPVYGPDARAFLVLRNPDALPRWFLPTAAEVMPREKVLDWIAGMRDAKRVALVAEETRGWLPAPRPWQADAVKPLRGLMGDFELHVGGAGERLLATSLPGPRGWSARGGDGAALRTLTVDGAFVGVRVPPGIDRVRLRYLPPGLWPGVAAAALGALGLLLVATSSAPAWWRGSARSRAGSRR
ncbi:MAG TPA: YfhO family protein [Thermoanaerobaculia bacterium]|jgi:hypothetical protein|nr:YfhO family protein [Thermoanaerobaculia bacterium]